MISKINYTISIAILAVGLVVSTACGTFDKLVNDFDKIGPVAVAILNTIGASGVAGPAAPVLSGIGTGLTLVQGALDAAESEPATVAQIDAAVMKVKSAI